MQVNLLLSICDLALVTTHTDHSRAGHVQKINLHRQEMDLLSLTLQKRKTQILDQPIGFAFSGPLKKQELPCPPYMSRHVFFLSALHGLTVKSRVSPQTSRSFATCCTNKSKKRLISMPHIDPSPSASRLSGLLQAAATGRSRGNHAFVGCLQSKQCSQIAELHRLRLAVLCQQVHLVHQLHSIALHSTLEKIQSWSRNL